MILDNADQRSLVIQQDVFIVAQEIAANWDATVFISARPQTFFQSKRAGALSAYPHKVFTILPPRPELVIEKRLIFALNIAEGNIEFNRLAGVKLNLRNIASFIRVLLYSLRNNTDLTEMLSNITAGNIRDVVEFITHFIGSPNVEAEKIVDFDQRGIAYVIPLHEFSKAAILGDYSHFVSNSSLAMNVFDVETADRKEHFLGLIIIAYLLWDNAARDRDGFLATGLVYDETQSLGFLPLQCDSALRRLEHFHYWRRYPEFAR